MCVSGASIMVVVVIGSLSERLYYDVHDAACGVLHYGVLCEIE